MNRKLKQIILLLGDLAVLHLALWLSLWLRSLSVSAVLRWGEHLSYFTPLFILWLMILYISGAYNLNLVYNFKRFRVTATNAILSGGLIAVVYFYLKQSEINPKTILVIFIGVFTLLFFTWRYIFNFFVKAYLPKNNLAFIGWNKEIEKMLDDIKNQPHQGFETALVFKNPEEILNLPSILREKNVHTIVIAPGLSDNAKLNETLFNCLNLKITFYSLVDFYELINGKVPLEAIDQSWFISSLNENKQRYFNVFKRTFDLVLAGILLILSLPFWPLIALAIKLDSRGPVFFTQKRVGLNEKVFEMLKFRTMKTSGNDGSMTQENDKRITKLGNFLRKTRLDEIPQVVNILKGQMSFIGPRPERPEYVEELAKQIPFYKTRLLIKPGVSGWDQISGVYHSPSLEDTMEKLQYDLYYLKHRSIYLDIAIFLKTVATVLGRGGR